MHGFFAEICGKFREDALFPLFGRQRPHGFCMDIGNEADEDAVRVFAVVVVDKVLSGVGVVVDLLDHTSATEPGARESLVTPEGGFVHSVYFDDQSHGDMLLCDHLSTWQGRHLLDARVEDWRDSHARVFGVDDYLVGVGGDAAGRTVIGYTVAHISGCLIELISGGWVRGGPVELSYW